MEEIYGFVDVLEPATDGPGVLRVSACIRLIATEEGDRAGPITHNYRPNHNFGGADERIFYIGRLEMDAGRWIHPGDTAEVTVTFFNVAGLAALLYVGRQWRIQQGGQLVAEAEVLSILP